MGRFIEEIIKDKMIPSHSFLGKLTSTERIISDRIADHDFILYHSRNYGKITNAKEFHTLTQNSVQKGSLATNCGNFQNITFGPKCSVLNRMLYSIENQNRLEHTMLTKANHYKFIEK